MDKKCLGQVFTPSWVVVEILDLIGYQGKGVLGRHILDNSCGDGAFLVVVVRRYCEAWKMYSGKYASPDWKELLKRDLQSYIHGIDIDPECCRACIENLDAVAAEAGVTGVQWDITCGDALDISGGMYGTMDFVVGNPPYVKVHNIPEERRKIRLPGVTAEIRDFYVAFIRLGIAVLNDKGKMCLITPSLWLRGCGDKTLRREVLGNGWLKAIVSMDSMQVFPKVSTYTAISLFDVGKDNSTNAGSPGMLQYQNYADVGEMDLFRQNTCLPGDYHHLGRMPYTACVFGGKIYVGSRYDLGRFRNIILYDERKHVRVRNGFSTLADRLFIGENIPHSRYGIRVIKASTGKWDKCFFPYDREGNIIQEDLLKEDGSLWNYLLENKEALEKRDNDYPEFYSFGRYQGVRDVFREKISASSIARDVDSMKLTYVPPGAGVYGGLYILPEDGVGIEDIRKALSDDDFPMFLRILGKFKSGGYYAFSSTELENFLNFKLSSILKKQMSPQEGDL